MTSKNRTTIYLLCQVGGWGTYNALGLFFFLQSNAEIRLHWKRSAWVFAFSAVIGILTTHCYRFLVRRRGWLQLSAGQAFLRLLVSSVVLGAVMVALVAQVWLLFGIGDFKHFGWVFPAVLSWTWIAFVWNLLYFGAHYFEEYRRVQLEKLQLSVVAKEAQLQRLVAQINPHFIFNCLNSLRALITEDPRRAQTMVTELSELLRYSLQSGKTLTVPLRAELEMADTYLKLEAIRFEERLAVQMDVAPQTLDLPIPSMLVQSLVENGVKHGVEKLPQGGQIRVSSQLENGSLRIQVLSSGQLSARTNSTGIGLNNARERLRLLYGKNASLVLENQGRDWVRAEILVPVEHKH